MDRSLPIFSFVWRFIWRLAWWGTRDGAIMGGFFGALIGAALLVPAIARALLMEINGAVLFLSLISAFVGGSVGATSGALVGFVVGVINGLVLGIITRAYFFPLTNIPLYRRLIRGAGIILSLITSIGSALLFYQSPGLPYAALLPLFAPLFACVYAWRVSPRLVRWYIYCTKSVDEILALIRAGISL